MDRKKQNEEDMKRFILTLTVMLACFAMSVDAAPHHRNHLDDAVVADTAHTGIEAYSDTASWDAAAAADSTYYASTPDMDDDLDDFPFFVDFCKPLFGMGGIAIAVIVCLLVLLFLFAPLIAIILIVRHLIKQRNDRIALAEKALERGLVFLNQPPEGCPVVKYRRLGNPCYVFATASRLSIPMRPSGARAYATCR